MRRTLGGIGLGLVATVFGVVLCYITLLMVAGKSCGAFDSGPDTEAQEAFCDGPWQYLVGLVPAVPLIGGGVLSVIRRSPWPVGFGALLAIAAAVATFALVP
jgi:hypothetical protein